VGSYPEDEMNKLILASCGKLIDTGSQRITTK
jgi:hypothetical protein